MHSMFDEQCAILLPPTEPCDSVSDAFAQHYTDPTQAAHSAHITAFHEACHAALHGSELLWVHIIPDGSNIAGMTKPKSDVLPNDHLAITALGGVFAALLTGDLDEIQIGIKNDVHQAVCASIRECGALATTLANIIAQPEVVESALMAYWTTTFDHLSDPPRMQAVRGIATALLNHGRLEGQEIVALARSAARSEAPRDVVKALNDIRTPLFQRGLPILQRASRTINLTIPVSR